MIKKFSKTLMSFLLIMGLILFPTSRSAAYSYSASAAIEYARSHCASNHTEYQSNCPNGWLCAEFVANCIKAGGLDIVPSQLKVVRALYNKLSGIGNCMEIEISSTQTSTGDRYIKNIGSNVGKISPGDVIITHCTKHDIYLHAILVSQINANGNIYAYAHNGNSFNGIVTASRSCKNINYAKEDYSDIKAYVIHFDGSGPAPTPQAPGYAAAINTDGSLAINDKPASSNAGLSTMLSAIPEGAVCKTYPDKASGSWMWVEFKGVSGYAYNKYLTSVDCIASNQLESGHPHRYYTQYSNGYIEYGADATQYVYQTVAPTCTEYGYEIEQCAYCSLSENRNYTEPLGHSWDEGTITTEPTNTSEGVVTYTCKNCTETKTESIDKLPETDSTNTPDSTASPADTSKPTATPVNNVNIPSGNTNNTYPTKKPVATSNQNTNTSTSSPDPYVEYKYDSKVKVGNKIKDSFFGGIYKVLSGKRVKFIKPLDKRKSIIIPETINYSGQSYKVVAIGAKAFFRNHNVTSVSLGKNISSIGHNAFNGCIKLQKIVISSTKLKSGSIGARAFRNLKRKPSIYFPASKQKSYQKLIRIK